MENNYVLAMYDIRGKQDFIYRSSRIKEIVGGSAIIRDCFKDYLFPLKGKETKGIYHGDSAFSREGFVQHIEEGYIGEVVYEGGGNFILLYQNEDICKEFTYLFSRKILEEIGSLKVLCTYIDQIDFDDYRGDEKRLYDKHRINEGQESVAAPLGTLPMVQLEYGTSMPLVTKVVERDREIKVSRETAAKLKKYQQELKRDSGIIGERVLDHLVTKRGEESLLAVIYIDGNNMGAQVQECLGNKKTYEECVAELRRFSQNIQENYIDNRIRDINTYYESAGTKKRRFVIYAGDEINFICNARDAYQLMHTYLCNLPQGASACAGAAVFHSHVSYAEAYRIAEECCESGKIIMKKHNMQDASLIDFHYCQGALDVSLERIREEENGTVISRPWLVRSGEKEEINEQFTTITEVEKMASFLRGLGRSNVKGLAEHARKSTANLELDLHRIRAHLDKQSAEALQDDFVWLDHMDREHKRKLIYDVVIMYDLWFRD